MYDEFFTTLTKAQKECIDSLPLTSVYMPKQKWGDLYTECVGLERGTIFPELDKPFLGRGTKK